MAFEDAIMAIGRALGLGGQPSQAAPTSQTRPAGSPPPAAANSAAPQSPQMPQQSGLERFIGNPLVQGAADAYLGTIASPRKQGWSRALARGGLEGMQGFNQAEQLKATLPLRQAQVQAVASQVPRNQSQTALNNARTQSLTVDPAMAADTAHQIELRLSDPSTPPNEKQILSLIYPSIKDGKMKPERVAELVSAGSVDAAKIAASNAEAGLHTAETAQLPIKTKQINAETNKDTSEAALANNRESEIAPTIQNLNARTAAADSTVAANRAKTPAEIANLNARTREANATAGAAPVKATAATTTATEKTTKDRSDAYQKAYALHKAEYITGNTSRITGAPKSQDIENYATSKANRDVLDTYGLPPEITTTSAALDYLTNKVGMQHDEAVQWIQQHHGAS